MKINYIEVCGFRSYGPQPQRVDVSAPLTVIHADNSQGKTSLAEAFEFLYTGGTSRRQLGGGSPGEFERALRNAHLSASADVYVEAEINLPDGNRKILRRQLIDDYEGATDCVSILTLDGVVIDSVTEAGFQLSDPPLAAPVLLEHSLRYAVSAKPGERSDYFKALLEVADLDLLRGEIASVVSEREAQPKEPLVLKLEGLYLHPQVDALVTPISSWERAGLSVALLSALDVLAPITEGKPQSSSLAVAIERVRGELEARQNTLLPLAKLRPSTAVVPKQRVRLADDPATLHGSPAAEPSLSTRLETYNAAVRRVDSAVAKVLPLFHAVLSIDTLPQHDGDEPTDCPLCQTPGSLTPERMRVIRQLLADQEGLTDASTKLRTAITHMSDDLAATRGWATASVPPAAEWGDDEREAYESAVAELQGQVDSFAAAAQLTVALKAKAETIGQYADAALTAIDRISGSVSRHADTALEDLEALEIAEGNLQGALVAHNLLLSRARDDSELVISAIAPRLASRSSTSGWAELLDLAEDEASLWNAIERQRGKDTATRRLKSAQRKIASAIKEVLDQKLEVMADEIRKWWSLMRPDELTAFDRLARRGAGNRYLDLTASLIPEVAASGVVRSALAVLSNSQLNALGLATFLARCQLLDSTVIFLDDPVPGSDREHRYTFADKVTSELLATGRQIVLTTHDAELARTLQALHQHVGTGEYAATLVDPRQGTQVVRTGDDFERLMLNASGQMNSPLVENRRAAGNSLRIATERLAKHILVAERRDAGDLEASLTDYDGKNLRDLRPLVIAYCKTPNEPGQWNTLARILNDSDHDTDPPHPADLKTCYDMLREVKRRHNVSTSSSSNSQ